MTKPQSKAKSTKYFRVEEGRYLFEKRINADRGSFPLLVTSKTLIKPLRVGSPAEASQEAKRLAEEITNLQLVASRDDRGAISTPNELARACKAWLWFTGSDKVLKDASVANRHTLQGQTDLETLDFLIDIVVDYYRHESDLGPYLTPFGASLFELLKTGKAKLMWSQCLPIYLRAKGKAALPDTDKSIRDSSKWLKSFMEVVGDKVLESITRQDVEQFIDSRLREVKSTTVQRELGTLQSIWACAALDQGISQSNPFTRQPIHGLGNDSEKRDVASLEDTRRLVALLSKKEQHSTYAPMLMIMALTGMRNNEVFGLSVSDVDFEKMVVYVQENEGRSLKTKASKRRIPIVGVLENWLRLHLKSRASATTTNPSSASNLMTRYLRKNGFSFTPYGLRHGMRDRLLDVRATELEVTELLGWTRSGKMIHHYGGNENLEHKANALRAVYKALAV